MERFIEVLSVVLALSLIGPVSAQVVAPQEEERSRNLLTLRHSSGRGRDGSSRRRQPTFRWR
jgi:hypothetical protein